MSSMVMLVLWIGFSIGAWVLYHKIFTVYYFSVTRGLMKELGTALIVGLMLTAITLYFWWLTAIIIVLAGYSVAGKVGDADKKKKSITAFIIVAVIVAIVGIGVRSSADAPKKTSSIRYENMQMALRMA